MTTFHAKRAAKRKRDQFRTNMDQAQWVLFVYHGLSRYPYTVVHDLARGDRFYSTVLVNAARLAILATGNRAQHQCAAAADFLRFTLRRPHATAFLTAYDLRHRGF